MRNRCTEAQIAIALRQAESGVAVEGFCPKDGDFLGGILPLEGQAPRPGGGGGPSAQAVGGGEPQAQATGGGPESGQVDAAGRPQGRCLTPVGKRDLVGKRTVAYQVSERPPDVVCGVGGGAIGGAIDHCTWEVLALRVAPWIRGIDVVLVLEAVATWHGRPTSIQGDHGPEFISQDVDRWADWNRVRLDFRLPGKPTPGADNATIESLNAGFRQESLNQQWFLSLPYAQERIEALGVDYNRVRPHSSLNTRPRPSSRLDVGLRLRLGLRLRPTPRAPAQLQRLVALDVDQGRGGDQVHERDPVRGMFSLPCGRTGMR